MGNILVYLLHGISAAILRSFWHLEMYLLLCFPPNPSFDESRDVSISTAASKKDFIRFELGCVSAAREKELQHIEG